MLARFPIPAEVSASRNIAHLLVVGSVLGRNRGVILLWQLGRFLFRRSSRRLSASQNTARYTLKPVRSAKCSRYSPSTASLSSATCWRST